jgi:hypothetical protein
MEQVLYVTALLKDGGDEALGISPSMLGPFARNIQRNGSERAHLKNRSVEVVGLLITGKETGERVIILGAKEDQP